MTHRFAAVAVLLTSALLVLAPARGLEAHRADDTKTLVARTRAYVADLQSKLAFGIFDETYTQSVTGEVREDSRTMTGELFLTYLPTDQIWIAVHDVKIIDGEPAPNHQDLALLIQRGSLESIRSEVTAQNERYNIGNINRNFNEPTLPLITMSPRRADDFSFSVSDVHDDHGVRLATLKFEERKDAAKLIASKSGQPFRSRGDLTIETETGVIRRTHLEFSGEVGAGKIAVEHTTDYAYDKASQLWLPSIFRERYDGHPQGQHEIVTCQATYTNFRRFQVLGRIKSSAIENR
jgi:hypothetical protein